MADTPSDIPSIITAQKNQIKNKIMRTPIKSLYFYAEYDSMLKVTNFKYLGYKKKS